MKILLVGVLLFLLIRRNRGKNGKGLLMYMLKERRINGLRELRGLGNLLDLVIGRFRLNWMVQWPVRRVSRLVGKVQRRVLWPRRRDKQSVS